MIYIQFGNQMIQAEEALMLLARYQMLPQFYRELIIDKAITDVILTLEEKNNAVEKFCQKNQLTTQSAIQRAFSCDYITEEQLEAAATRELRIEKFKIATWGNKLEQYFLQYKPQLDKVVYSILRSQDAEVARELYFRILAGEQSFADCARQYSQLPEAHTGGLIGPVLISQVRQGIAQKLVSYRPGKLLAPMKLENWYVILRLEKLIAAQLDDSTRAMLLNLLFEQWVSEQIQQTSILVKNQEMSEKANYAYPFTQPIVLSELCAYE